MMYKSCEAIEQGIAFMWDDIRICCNSSHAGGGFEKKPFFKYSDNMDFTWESFFEYKENIRNSNQNENLFEACKGCLYIENKEWNVNNKKLSYFNFNHWRDCDTKCIYCNVRRKPEQNRIKQIYPYLEILDKKQYIEPNGMVMFGGGDIAFLPEFEKIVKLFMKYNYRFNIATCATHYVPILGKLLEEGLVEVRISVDSAEKKTYERIKCTKFYNQVWKNIKKYAAKQACDWNLRLKYIIIPGINDNEEEILKWLKMSKKAGVKSVIIDIESGYLMRNMENTPDYIIKLFEYTKDNAEKLGLHFMVFDHASQLLNIFDNILSEYYFTEDVTQLKIIDYQNNKNKNMQKKYSFYDSLFRKFF